MLIKISYFLFNLKTVSGYTLRLYYEVCRLKSAGKQL